MERYKYFILNQKLAVVWGILQVACAGLTLVCGCMDAAFRMNTTLSETRAPVWVALVSKSYYWLTELVYFRFNTSYFCFHRSWQFLVSLHLLSLKRKIPPWLVVCAANSSSKLKYNHIFGSDICKMQCFDCLKL